jgi:aryl sulfotransferase
LHFNDLKSNLAHEIQKIAEFLDVAVDERKWARIVEHCTFDYMKRNAAKLSPGLGPLLAEGAEALVRRGAVGGWRDALSAADNETYERAAATNLPPECARWLTAGGRAE